MIIRALPSLSGFGLIVLMSGASWGQSVEVIPTVGGVTDLRDRGLSVSDKDVAGTASITIDTPSGFYTGVSGAFFGRTDFGDRARITPYAGFATPLGGYVLDVSASLDSFSGVGSDWRTFPEVSAAVSRDFGLAFIKTSVTYAPDGRWFTPDNNSLYVKGDLEIPVPGAAGATLIARYGYDIRDGRSNVSDYGVGLSVFLGDLEVTAMFEDSTQDGRLGGSAVIGGLRFFF